MKDYYSILGVSKDATILEIKSAYRRLAKLYHPDINKDPESSQKFRDINEAYHVLSDEEKRQRYDQILNSRDERAYKDFMQYIQEFVDSIINGMRAPKPRRGQDLRLKLELSLEEAAFGCTKTVKYERWVDCTHCEGKGYEGEPQLETCQACNGSGRRVSGIFSFPRPCSVCKGRGVIVKNTCRVCAGRGRVARVSAVEVSIPKGTEEGDVLLVKGFGHAGERGGQAGDLYLRVELLPHERFKKLGSDLHTEVFISFPRAVLGGEETIKGLDGKELKFFIQPGTECGSSVVLPKEGFPSPQGNGNLVIHIRIEVPKSISLSTKKLLEKLEKELSGESKGTLRRIFGL
ncbi:MAG: DnaJ C-terminal domain-containing protein [Aquificaceae bacterium]|nr:DnaJ C-terminal domain-containing protein [Aquificaceae bacterium]